jgi:hypothetical protein
MEHNILSTSFVCSDDKQLAAAVMQGHKWWVLAEALPQDAAQLISDYRNSDQNSNQVWRLSALRPTHSCTTVSI